MSPVEQPVVRLSQVAKSFPLGERKVAAVREASFAINEGEMAVLMGPSGSGKSTILALIAGLVALDSGTISVRDITVNTLAQDQLDRFRGEQIGIVFQRFNLVPVLTAIENVELALIPKKMAARARRERAGEWLARVGLAQRAGHFAANLSGGEQQRVAVARALATQPSIILADEPTASLDRNTAIDLIDLMANLSREYGKTFLIATHDQKVIERAQRVLLVDDGQCLG